MRIALPLQQFHGHQLGLVVGLPRRVVTGSDVDGDPEAEAAEVVTVGE